MIKLVILRHGQSSLNHENIFCGWIDAELTEKGLNQASEASNLIYDHFVTLKDNGDAEHAGKVKDESQLPTVGFASRLVRTNQTIAQIIKTLEQRTSPDNHHFDGVDEYHVVEFKQKNPEEDKGLQSKEQIVYKPVQQDGKDDNSGEYKGFKVYESWRLNERHYGSWQGQRKPQVLQKYGKDEYMRIRRDYNGKPPRVDLNKEMEVVPAALQREMNKENLNSSSHLSELQSKPMAQTGSELVYDFKEPNRSLKYRDEYTYGNFLDLPTAESLNDVIHRLQSYLYDFIIPKILATDNKTGLIVAHGSSVRSLLKILCNISEEDIKNVDIPNGIPLVVELKEDFTFIRRYYLDPEQAKINAEKVRNEGFQ
ncbi:hypothetical protein ACO0QE_000214 [Hanseniaspora vineae]